MPCRGPSTGNLAGLEWVENPDVQLPEIRFISRGDDRSVNACSRGNHSVLQQSIWFSVHDPAPLPKAWCIHRQYLIRSRQLICPKLDVTRLRSHGYGESFLRSSCVLLHHCQCSVYACLPAKVLDEPQTLRCRICFLTYRCNKLARPCRGPLKCTVWRE